MALKAGYKGVKKSFIDKLTTLLSAKVIKSIGNGLSLSEQGALAAEIDTETMEFKTGKLAAKIPEIPATYSRIKVYDGEGSPAGLSEDISMILPSGKTLSDYDAIIFVTGQTSDGGLSTIQAERIAFLNFNTSLKLVFEGYYQRSMIVSLDYANNTFNYTSTASSENEGYRLRIYEVHLIKF